MGFNSAFKGLNFALCNLWARSCCVIMFNFFLPWPNSTSGPRPPHCRGFMITLRHTTVGRTPLEKWSARRRDLYLTTHNTHNRQTYMLPTGFEPMVPASKRPQTQALDRAVSWIGIMLNNYHINSWITVVINRTIYCDVHEHCLVPALRMCEIYVTLSLTVIKIILFNGINFLNFLVKTSVFVS